ncbi:hypothetical protein NE476_31580, partial [Enterocloster bolteae]|nr:hypothetical protein [Enterocloster bolteae]
FSTASDTYEPLIIITYVLEDGTEIKISANNTEVFFNGNGHQFKDAEIFGNLTKAVFFRKRLQERERNKERTMKKIALALSIIFIILTFAGVAYVL